MHLMDGTFTTMALTENTKVRDVVRYMCRQHALNNESEWGLLEFWDHPGINVRVRVRVKVRPLTPTRTLTLALALAQALALTLSLSLSLTAALFQSPVLRRAR